MKLFVILAATMAASTQVSHSQVDLAERETTVILSSCSIVPYPKELVILDYEDQSELERIRLEPGRCDDYTVELPENGALIYARATESKALQRLNKYYDFEAAWGGVPVSAPNHSGVWGCLNARTGDIERIKTSSGCTYSETELELGYLSPEANGYGIFVEDRHLCQTIRPVCADADGNFLLDWARNLSISLEISLRAWTHTDGSYGLIPFASGLETIDQNGPFARGILITEKQAETTPLGSPVPAEAGDLILSLNGEPVFDRDDFIMLAIEHGARAGYENPYTIELERNGSRFTSRGYMVFHRDVYGQFFQNPDGSCRNTTSALLSSGLHEATFYTKPLLACLNFDIRNMTINRQHDCEFAVRQLTAAYRQYCPAFTRGGAIVGSVFMPGREAAESVVRKLSVKNMSRVPAAIIVEVSEEVGRSIITLPPGVRAEDNWGSIGQQAGFGVAVGSGFRLITMK